MTKRNIADGVFVSAQLRQRAVEAPRYAISQEQLREMRTQRDTYLGAIPYDVLAMVSDHINWCDVCYIRLPPSARPQRVRVDDVVDVYRWCCQSCTTCVKCVRSITSNVVGHPVGRVEQVSCNGVRFLRAPLPRERYKKHYNGVMCSFCYLNLFAR